MARPGARCPSHLPVELVQGGHQLVVALALGLPLGRVEQRKLLVVGVGGSGKCRIHRVDRVPNATAYEKIPTSPDTRPATLRPQP